MQERVILNERQLTGAEKELLDAVDMKMREQPALQYHEALKLVAMENEDLSRRYTAAVRGLTGRRG